MTFAIDSARIATKNKAEPIILAGDFIRFYSAFIYLESFLRTCLPLIRKKAGIRTP
jgi:hypothetical protein